MSCYKICKFWIVLDFATTVEIFIYFPVIIVGCSDIGGVENIMTDNPKIKASKAVDDARVAAHAVYDDATVAARNILKDAGVEAQKVSDDVKIGVHKDARFRIALISEDRAMLSRYSDHVSTRHISQPRESTWSFLLLYR